MSIIIDRLSKHYGAQKAVDDISFEAKPGEITGFLGPNGAGKSTTMKIATGYLFPTSGTIRVADIDVRQFPKKAKQVTGYLPEHNPLYPEMYVKEYLSFVAGSYRIQGKAKRKKIGEMVDLCGLGREQHKKIKALSKGYRQRVGLAQAMISDPEVLILDEPTTGLDPNQIQEIRMVIKQISVSKTVILSTHIMQEVEAICDKVVIINRGSIVADGTLATLRSTSANAEMFEVRFENEVDESLFANDGLQIENIDGLTFRIAGQAGEARKVIMRRVTDHDLPLISISKVGDSLEEIFQSLTQDQHD
ncbi:MAG: gliding motility-associated ABC transporter ATP-binding subunit GldA [Cyclobacteriaceae bacterium]|nr:gliding motility-associated ABC transporter ATP-binding subunit GldA [Cyclobacteriaceae bacterium HetDA_MAG_MS6]